MEKQFNLLAGMVNKWHASLDASGKPATFALQLKGRPPRVYGGGEPAFTLVVNDESGLKALSSLDGTTVIEAYMSGALDVEGDLTAALSLREMFTDRHPLRHLWRFVRPLLFGQVKSDAGWIQQHYDYDADFYLLFLDRDHRCYSQGVFEDDGEPLEAGIRRKLDFAFESAGLKPGDSVLDIGAGWGAFAQYAGRRGVKVTSLTISEASEKFVNALIERENLPCRVVREHLLAYSPGERYDAVVNMGVTEHLPDYRATLAKYRELLRPGGRVYLDASASRVKHEGHSFIYRHIFPGNGSFWCLHDYLAQLAATPFRLRAVHDDRHSYYLTTKYWAENLDRNREEVARRWGKALYRKFQIYLWGSTKGFQDDDLQAYRAVLEMP
jgi:cyclopropane-fatty-acyl-phospholipid synthase